MINMPNLISTNIAGKATYKVLNYLQHYSTANTVSMCRTGCPKQNYTIITVEDSQSSSFLLS